MHAHLSYTLGCHSFLISLTLSSKFSSRYTIIWISALCSKANTKQCSDLQHARVNLQAIQHTVTCNLIISYFHIFLMWEWYRVCIRACPTNIIGTLQTVLQHLPCQRPQRYVAVSPPPTPRACSSICTCANESGKRCRHMAHIPQASTYYIFSQQHSHARQQCRGGQAFSRCKSKTRDSVCLGLCYKRWKFTVILYTAHSTYHTCDSNDQNSNNRKNSLLYMKTHRHILKFAYTFYLWKYTHMLLGVVLTGQLARCRSSLSPCKWLHSLSMSRPTAPLTVCMCACVRMFAFLHAILYNYLDARAQMPILFHIYIYIYIYIYI